MNNKNQEIGFVKDIDFDKKEATVSFDAAVLSPEKISETVEATADGKTYKVSDVKIKA